jgi:hypothetical protein
MAGLYAPIGGGMSGSSTPGYTAGAVVNPAGVATPAIAAYGPTTSGVGSVSATSSGHIGVYIGIAALVGLLLIRHSLPR